MKKILVLIIGILMITMFCACSNSSVTNNEKDVNDQNDSVNYEEYNEMDEYNRNIKIEIGNEVFTATLEDNNTARNFKSLLPLTISMDDLNSNEKAYNLSQNIRKDSASNPGTIQVGDIMCWSNNVLVLFYESFNTSYRYVKIGSVDDTSGFVEALGSDSVEVTITE